MDQDDALELENVATTDSGASRNMEQATHATRFTTQATRFTDDLDSSDEERPSQQRSSVCEQAKAPGVSPSSSSSGSSVDLDDYIQRVAQQKNRDRHKRQPDRPAVRRKSRGQSRKIKRSPTCTQWISWMWTYVNMYMGLIVKILGFLAIVVAVVLGFLFIKQVFDILFNTDISTGEENFAQIDAICEKGMPSYKATSPYPYPVVYVDYDMVSRHLLCDTTTDKGGWLVIHRRSGLEVSFNRDWMEYKQGFGDLFTDFWAGLETMHNLTSSRDYELRVDVINHDTKLSAFAHYSTFFVSSEQDDYRLSVGAYEGDAVDGFSSDRLDPSLVQNNMSFTTFDRDNDNATYNCAEQYFSGWWFNACSSSNLNTWPLKWNGYRVDLAEMKIRPVYHLTTDTPINRFKHENLEKQNEEIGR